MIAAGGGVASAAALRAAGVHRNAVARRLRDGRLVEPFAGVFALGVLPDDVRRRAAVLSCGAGAVLADWSCAEHRGLITFQEPADDRVHVIVGERRCPRRPGIAVHRVGTLDPRDVVEHDGVRCLTVARLLLRLAATRDARFVERLIDEAAYQGSWRPWEVEELLVRTRGQRGHAVLEQAFRRHVPGTTRTQNELEEAFLAICDAQGWPRPICQQPDTLRSGRRIRHDFLWPDLRVAGETDGGRGHAGAYRQARDAERDADLRARGIEVVRAQWDEVFHRPAVVVARVGPVLLARGARFGRPRRR
ncbi:hypothetical protein GKE82_14035 [Conexibacter sp. W3-3-2]|uniref:hypothetical protein n=1 Tax=Conexibacter sp. W3-3-2 TaxID=2675227 RepID=UPI0012B86E72|nr:hypothetical protein [Conexibacter sp. W3-3-2]MTD45376.1 hypothetical protein [Conexibacter sp. W3-3-2]